MIAIPNYTSNYVIYNKYHKYCKVQIQRLQCPNSNIANLIISAKGSAADKSCMGLTQWLQITLSYALPIQSLAFLEPLLFCSTRRLWPTYHSSFLINCMFNLSTLGTLALARKNLASVISGKVPRYEFKVIFERCRSKHSTWLSL